MAPLPPALPATLGEACHLVLLTGEPRAKVKAARAVARAWRRGELAHAFPGAMPERPTRPEAPELVAPNRMPKRGRGGSERARVAMLHALAHIEYVAIDLAFDMAGRFGAGLPRGFADDFVGVGADEAMHFALLTRRLAAQGSQYGALPAHDGLWEAAAETAHDVKARLAILPMVLEARGLDVSPATIARFASAGDSASARLLTRILTDEERHVLIGTRWFQNRCQALTLDPVVTWQGLVAQHFRGLLKPPFNDSARLRAGLTREYYAAVA